MTAKTTYARHVGPLEEGAWGYLKARPITVFFGMLSTDEVIRHVDTGDANVVWFPEVAAGVVLHPTEQADLGSEILAASMDEDQVVFTNSMLMILRLLRLVRQGKLSTENICFYHVGPSQFTRLLTTDEGKFDGPVPDQFFSQDVEEIFGGDG